MALRKKKNNFLKQPWSKKKNKKNIVAIAILLVTVVALVFFFVILFNYLFPAVNKEGVKDKVEVVLFFPDAKERFLVAEKRRVTKRNNREAQLKEIVEMLIAGSHTGKVNCFPAGVVLQSLQVGADGVANISFNPDLATKHPGGTTAELMTVYSLVNTLIKNDHKLTKVRILLDGKAISSLKGHIDTSEPLTYREMQSGGDKK